MKALQVVRSAYRCTLEEQDDPAVWIARAMKGAGADLSVLLRGNAVLYACGGQDAAGLSIGGRAQANPPRIDREIQGLLASGAPVLVVSEDLAERGIAPADLVAGVRAVARGALPGLFAEHDAVWHW